MTIGFLNNYEIIYKPKNHSRWAFEIAFSTGEKFAQHQVEALLGGGFRNRGLLLSNSTSVSPEGLLQSTSQDRIPVRGLCCCILEACSVTATPVKTLSFKRKSYSQRSTIDMKVKLKAPRNICRNTSYVGLQNKDCRSSIANSIHKEEALRGNASSSESYTQYIM